MRLSALDGWRGLCALLVAVFHFNTATDFSFSPFIRNSFLFVEFFFVLSGFVICHAYAQRLNTFNDWLVYAVKRFGRLWPLHLVLLVALVPVALAEHFVLAEGDGRFSLQAFGANLLMIHALGLFNTETWNFVSWSISVEFYTCLLFGSVCVMARPSLWLYGSFSLLGAVVVWCFGGLNDTYQFAFFRGVYGFFLGCFVYQLYSPSPLRKLEGVPGRVWSSVFEVVALIIVVAFLAWGVNSQNMIVSPLLFAVVVVVYAPGLGVVSTILKTRLIQNLGLYSYSIYLLHGVLVTVVKGGLFVLQKWLGVNLLESYEDIKIIDLGADWSNLLATLIFVVVLYQLSKWSYHWIEDPWRRRFGGWAERLNAPRPAKPIENEVGQDVERMTETGSKV